jgi:hypothetical protein
VGFSDWWFLTGATKREREGEREREGDRKRKMEGESVRLGRNGVPSSDGRPPLSKPVLARHSSFVSILL